MLDDAYPKEAWIREYTDGSSNEAIKNGGAGIYIEYPDGQGKSAAIPTGLHCTNFKAEVEALVHAANIISESSSPDMQVVFLTDAQSVLKTNIDNELPTLNEALRNIRCHRVVLQWIPSHCGITGNEEADRLAKLGSGMEQIDNHVSFSEMKTCIKSLHRPRQLHDSYHQLTRGEQVVIFRLRTGHNRLRHHLHRKLHLLTSPMCPCGDAEQTTDHILQDCQLLGSLRSEIWHTPVSVHHKLYGPVESLQKTTHFIQKAGLQV